nr:immunoglobulin light chain junction region [Macaca mulatta]MOW08822.1 immunoglobulin light chain junction region [Macaca mulatta]MOW09505.1 immunoglobulin light chain junction region [Macaca mulatta]MOW10863.1 immunoglobulin light chain junction region [Macaca mulatta]MOW13744.1 immunoglobulin light chain junction region [Macaca mulatta]
CQQHHTYPWTF